MKATKWSLRLGCVTPTRSSQPGGGTWRIGAAVWALVAVCAGLATPACAGSYGNAVLSDSPYVYWPLDETSGTTVDDAAGTRNGTLNNGTGSIDLTGLGPRPPAFGGFAADNTGAEFSGYDTGDEIITVGADIGASYTMEAWFKIDVGEGGTVMALGEVNDYNKYRFISMSTATGKITVTQRNSGDGSATLTDGQGSTAATITFDPNTVVNDGAWHYVAAVFSPDTNDGDDNAATTYRLQIWIDPETTTPQSTFYHSQGDIGESHMFVGALKRKSSNVYQVMGDFAGQLDEIALYNAALTGEQVLSHYTAGIGAPAGTLITIH